MALDQALFEHAGKTGVANIRLYNWGGPARTVGYFHRSESVDRMSIRRFTGGGIVDHGEDVTFVLNLPATKTATDALYRWIHRMLADALTKAGFAASLEPTGRSSAGGDCFAQPVTSDILDAGGVKIGGGAQRRSRGAVIHQGSIRLPEELRDLDATWIDGFIQNLAERSEPFFDESKSNLDGIATKYVRNRYGTEQWNRRQ